MSLKIFYTFIIFVNFLILLNLNKIAKIINVYDKPDNTRKFHKNATPLLGGLILLISLTLFYIFDLNIKHFSLDGKYKTYLLSFFYIFFIFGLIDDKKAISPNIKLLIQVIFSFLFIYIFRDEILSNYLNFSFLNFTIYLKGYEVLFYTICVVIFVNALNMFDGINGQTSTFIFFVLFVLFLKNYNIELILTLIIVNSFIFYLNFKDRIFFGDSGIYLLAILISFFTIDAHKSNLLFADEIVLILLLPGIDMLRLFIVRLSAKKNPFYPDREHLHHILLRKFDYSKTFFILILLMITPYLMGLLFNSIISILIFSLIYFLIIIQITQKKT